MSIVRLKKNSMTNDAAHNCVGIWLTSKTCYLLGPLWDRIILWTLEIWRPFTCTIVVGKKQTVVMCHRPINLCCVIFNDILPIQEWLNNGIDGYLNNTYWLIWTQAQAISMKDWNGALFQWVSHDTSAQGLCWGSAHHHIVLPPSNDAFWEWREHCFEYEEKISPCLKNIVWCGLCSSLDTTKGMLLRINTYFLWHFIITDLEQIVHFPQHLRLYEKKNRIDVQYRISGSVVSGSADLQVNPLPSNSKVLCSETNICATTARAFCGMNFVSVGHGWLAVLSKEETNVCRVFESLHLWNATFTALVVRMQHRSSFDVP